MLRCATLRGTALLLGAGLAALLAACGSGNAAHVIPITVTQTVTATTPTGPTATAYSATTGQPSSTTSAQTRTAGEPAFTGGVTAPASTSPSGGLTSAVATLAAHGYRPVSVATYNSGDTLRVLIGASGSGSEQAFFFLGNQYLGTDTSTPSASITVVGANDTTVTLRYGLRSGGSQTVSFQLNQGQLSPLTPIPSAAARG